LRTLVHSIHIFLGLLATLTCFIVGLSTYFFSVRGNLGFRSGAGVREKTPRGILAFRQGLRTSGVGLLQGRLSVGVCLE
jgi:hypothetical protein